MKKFSAKRVFAIFGIVFLGVAAFAGAVFGVLALMGKFKTPIVYPTELVFLDNDKIVVAFDNGKSATGFKFVNNVFKYGV